jgi:arginase
MAFTIVGAPIDSVGLGRAEPHGTELAPAALRAAGLDRFGWPDLGDLDIRIPDHDRDPATGVIGIDGVLTSTAEIRRSIFESVAQGRRPFVLGGCCALLPGALAGARDAVGALGLVYVDGHLDFYDGVTSPTGEAADMPIAVVLGEGPAPWVEQCGPVPVVEPSAMALLGYHDPDELADVGDQLPDRRASGIFDAPATLVRREGAGACGVAAFEHVRRAAGPIWLHIDLDVLDRDTFAATDYLMPGGLEWSELVDLARPAADSPDLVGWSLSCYNPEKDPLGRDGRAIVAAIEELFGQSG